MRSVIHMRRPGHMLVWCGALIWLAASMGCGLKGFECRQDSDCSQGKACTNGWCKTTATTIPSPGCKVGALRPCPSTSSIFPICEYGEQRCQKDGTWGECTGVVLSQAESCNQSDDNCNGLIDEGLDCGCQPGKSRACRVTYPLEGRCTPGKQYCGSDGTWGACEQQIKPRLEVCNGFDDDCDGLTDEDAQGDPLARPCYNGPDATAGKGTCQAGTQRCLNGLWQACTGQRLPAPERCNGKDDNCNGRVDETCKPCSHNHFARYIGAPYDHNAAHVAWTPDGKYILGAAASGTLQIWDAASRTYLRSVVLHGSLEPTVPPALSPDGQFVAFAMSDHNIELYLLPKGDHVATLRGHQKAISALAFHPDGQRLISLSSQAHELRLWSTRNGTLQKKIATSPQHQWTDIALSPAGRWLLTLSRDHSQLGLWAFGADQHSRLYQSCPTGHIAARFRDSQHFDVLCQGNDERNAAIERWNLLDHKRLSTHQLPAKALVSGVIQLSPSLGRHIALVIPAQTSQPVLLDLQTRQTLQTFDVGEHATGRTPLRSVRLNPSGDYLLGSNGTDELWLWKIGSRTPAGALQQIVDRHHKPIFSMSLNHDGTQLATSSLQEQAIRLWDLTPGSASFGQQQAELHNASGAGGQLAYSHDGKWLASTDIYNQIVVWNTSTHTTQHILSKHGYPISQLLFSPDGTSLVSVSKAGRTAIVWSLPRGEFVRYLTLQPLQAAAFHPDGKRIAMALKQHIQIATIDGSQPDVTLRTSAPDAIQWMLFHPAGELLLFADKALHGWRWTDASAAQALASWVPESLRAIHPSGQLMALGQDGGRSIAFLDPTTGQALGKLHQNTYAPEFTGVLFGQTPQQMITSHTNGLLKLWDCTREALP